MAKSIEVSIKKVPINSQGYDRRGRYWGTGAPLYHFELYNEVTKQEETGEVRAYNNKDARERVKARYPEFFTKSNPGMPKGKWVKAKAVKFNRDGSISIAR